MFARQYGLELAGVHTGALSLRRCWVLLAGLDWSDPAAQALHAKLPKPKATAGDTFAVLSQMKAG